MANNSAMKIKIQSVDDLFASSTPISAPEESLKHVEEPVKVMQLEETGEKLEIVELDLDDTYEFEGHPFKVLEDEKMMETVDSIKKYGVLVPGIARPGKNCGYEVIAGHRRRLGSRLAGNTKMPFIVRNYSDAEATIIMVDSNIQREGLLPSEKAKAYKMRMDAEKQLKKEGKSDSGRSDSLLSRKLGESRNTIQRYIRLNYLNDRLLELVDEGKLKFTVGVELSYLKLNEQEWVWKLYEDEGLLPGLAEATQLKECSKSDELNKRMVSMVLLKDKPTSVKVTLTPKTIRSYFPEDYTREQVERIILQLLENWKEEQFG